MVDWAKVVWLEVPGLGDNPPAFHGFHYTDIISSWSLNINVLELQNSFEDREGIQYSLLNFNPFLPIGWHISRIFTKRF